MLKTNQPEGIPSGQKTLYLSNLFLDRGALDAEEFQGGDEFGGDSDLELGGVELDLVLGLWIVEVHLERDGAPVGLDQGHEILAELLGQHRGGDADGESVQQCLVDVAQKHYLLDPESVRRSLALSALLRLDEEFLLYVALNVKALVRLHVTHESLVVTAEQGQFVGSAVILQLRL